MSLTRRSPTGEREVPGDGRPRSPLSPPSPTGGPPQALLGLLVTEENLDKLPAEALEEWNAALDEYDELMKSEPS